MLDELCRHDRRGSLTSAASGFAVVSAFLVQQCDIA